MRPHRRRSRTVQAYSPGGANVPQHKRHLDWFSCLMQDSLVWQTDGQITLLGRQQQTTSTYVVRAMWSNNAQSVD